jgi:hypothetical protein
MIGQKRSLEFLIPVALKRLNQDPFVEGDFFPGDLLRSVMRVKVDFWANHPELFYWTLRVVQRASELLPSLEEGDRPHDDVFRLFDKSPWSTE